MASLTIPESELPSFAKLSNLSEAEFSGLIAGIKKTAPSLTPKQFASELCKHFSDLRIQDLRVIVTVIFNVIRTGDSMNESTGRVAEMLLEGLSELDGYKKHFSEEKGKLLSKRILEAASAGDSIRVSAKALNVMTEHNRVFLNARILSDIRPVFTDTLKSASAGLIIHNLAITFRENRETCEAFFALDEDDINKLKAVIQRAEEKSGALKEMLQSAGVHRISPKSE